MLVVGFIIALIQGQVLPMIEVFPDVATCKETVAKAVKNIESKGVEVISSKCVEAK